MDTYESLILQCSKLERELAECRNQLKMVLKYIDDIVYLLDERGDVQYISNSVQEYGYSPLELKGKSILEIVHPDDWEVARYRVNERRTGERKTINLELRFVARDIPRPSFSPDTNLPEESYMSVTAEGYYSGRENKIFRGTFGIARTTVRPIGERMQTNNRTMLKPLRLIPICSGCKKIRDAHDDWVMFESYLAEKHGIQFTHSICPACARTLYPELPVKAIK